MEESRSCRDDCKEETDEESEDAAAAMATAQ